jgi:hypothetical protein
MMRAEFGHDEPGDRLVPGGQELVLNLEQRDPVMTARWASWEFRR